MSRRISWLKIEQILSENKGVRVSLTLDYSVADYPNFKPYVESVSVEEFSEKLNKVYFELIHDYDMQAQKAFCVMYFYGLDIATVRKIIRLVRYFIEPDIFPLDKTLYNALKKINAKYIEVTRFSSRRYITVRARAAA